jgi:GNAT superfamily N-acetyltransferase
MESNDLELSTGVEGLTTDQLEGFFEGWPARPSSESLLRILQGSYRVVLARDPSGRVVGMATSISDGVLSAFIPILEILPEYRNRGTGTALMSRMLDELRGVYAIDLTCDEEVAPFYGRLGMTRTVGMSLRDSSAAERLSRAGDTDSPA